MNGGRDSCDIALRSSSSPDSWAGSVCAGSVGSAMVRRVLEAPLSLALGRISYSVYLTHEAVLTVSLIALEAIDLSVIGQWPFFLVLLSLTVGGTIGISWLLYRSVEAPFIAFGKRGTSGWVGSAAARRSYSRTTRRWKSGPADSSRSRRAPISR